MGSRARFICIVLFAATVLGTAACGSVTKPTGVEVRRQLDGSTLFIDHDYRYSLSLDSEWWLVPLVDEEYQSALSKARQDIPDFADRLEAARNEDPDGRAVAFNLAHDLKYYGGGGFVTYLKISKAYHGVYDSPSLSAWISDGRSVAEKSGFEVLMSGTNLNPNGVECGTVDAIQPAHAKPTIPVTLRARMVTCLIHVAGITLAFWTPEQFGDELVPAVESAGESIRVLDE